MENTTLKPKTSLRWRMLRWGLIGLAGLITLGAVFWVEENWRGKRAWENFKHEWEAKGEKFDLKAFIPPTVPDEENFAMTPFLAPVLDFRPNRKPGESAWRDTNAFQKTEDFAKDLGSVKDNNSGRWARAQRMDLTAWATALSGKSNVPESGESLSARAEAAEAVLARMKKYEPVLEELRTASRRPYCRFNISYGDEDPAAVLLPHLALVKKLSLLYRLRASAELAAGQSGPGLEDIKMGFYLSTGIKDEPILISGLVEIAMVNITLQPVWEGLADHRWSDTQLRELQQQLEKFDLLSGYGVTMRGERAFGNAVLDYQRRKRRFETYDSSAPAIVYNWMPSGWYYQNELIANRVFQQMILPLMDGEKHRVYLDLSTNFEGRLAKELQGDFIMYTVFANIWCPAVPKAVKKFANDQAAVDEAIIACGLERYRLAHGQFPETLGALSPQFVERIRADLVTGEPLKYRRTGDGQFILYSVGWNGTDDGGTVVMGKGSTPPVDITQGDWVWRYPEK